MQLRQINVGCFGGGTGLPALLGGLKRNPWLHVNAVVTMFDTGGSSGQLTRRTRRAAARRRAALRARAGPQRGRSPTRAAGAAADAFDHERLGGHTGGNLLLSMMEQYSGDFLAAVDGLRALLGCRGRVWPVSVERATLCAEYADGSVTRGEVEVDLGHGAATASRGCGSSRRAHPSCRARGHQRVRRGDHRPRQLLHQPDADAAGGRRRRPAAHGQGSDHSRHQPAHRRSRACAASRPPMRRAG